MRFRFLANGLIVQSLMFGFEARSDTTAAAQEAPSVVPTADLIDLQPQRDYTPEDIRNHERAVAAIQEIRRSLVGKSDEQLLAMLRPARLPFIGQGHTPDYFVARDTNRMIEAALRKRAVLARATLQAHEKDSMGIFMQQPDIQTVGNLCHKLLIEIKATEAATLDQKLIIAAYNGDAANVRKCLAEGAQVNARYGARGRDVMDALGAIQWTALYAVSDSSRAADPLTIAKLLVEAGASVDLCDEHGDTPLEKAVFHDQLELARYLLDHGAASNVRDHGLGYTPIFSAAQNPKMMDLLIARGADVNARNGNGDTPLYFAVRDRNINIVKKLLDAGANASVQNKRGETPLHVVGDVDTARLLLACEARVDVKDADDFTPLLRNEWTLRGIWLEHRAYIRAITPPPGYRGGWDVTVLRDFTLERLENEGLKGEELVRKLNDLRPPEQKALAELLKSAAAGNDR